MRFKRKTRREWNHRDEESALRTVSVAVKRLKKRSKKKRINHGFGKMATITVIKVIPVK